MTDVSVKRINFDYLERMKLTPNVCVIDIETLSKQVDAKIANIACVIKNVFTGDIVNVFYVRCNWLMQSAYRSSDTDTIDWWAKQLLANPIAHHQAFNHDSKRTELSRALVMLNEFIMSHTEHRPQVMGNGPEFDNAILEHAMRHFNIKPAWDYGCNQSLRTVVLMGRLLLGFDPKYSNEFIGVKYNALDDALHEANYLHTIFKAFVERLSPPANAPAFAITKDRLLSLLEVFELDNSEDVNPDSGKAHRAIVELFFEEFNLIGE